MDYETIKRREALVREIDEAKESIEELPRSKREIKLYLLCPEYLRHSLPRDYMGYLLSQHSDELRHKINDTVQQVLDEYAKELEEKIELKKKELEEL